MISEDSYQTARVHVCAGFVVTGSYFVIKLFSCSTSMKFFHAYKSQITNDAKFFLVKHR